MTGPLSPVECGGCGWAGRRKPGNVVECPRCGGAASYQEVIGMSDYLDQIDREERDDVEAALRLKLAECRRRIEAMEAERDAARAEARVAMADAYRMGQEAEREACAETCQSVGLYLVQLGESSFVARECFEAIRDRSNEEPGQ